MEPETIEQKKLILPQHVTKKRKQMSSGIKTSNRFGDLNEAALYSGGEEGIRGVEQRKWKPNRAGSGTAFHRGSSAAIDVKHSDLQKDDIKIGKMPVPDALPQDSAPLPQRENQDWQTMMKELQENGLDILSIESSQSSVIDAPKDEDAPSPKKRKIEETIHENEQIVDRKASDAFATENASIAAMPVAAQEHQLVFSPSWAAQPLPGWAESIQKSFKSSKFKKAAAIAGGVALLGAGIYAATKRPDLVINGIVCTQKAWNDVIAPYSQSAISAASAKVSVVVGAVQPALQMVQTRLEPIIDLVSQTASNIVQHARPLINSVRL